MKVAQFASLALAATLTAPMLAPQTAQAAAIISAVSATASDSFPDPTFGTVTNLINQGGLLTTYVSGVTDFDVYIAGDPRHTITSSGAEWFTNFGSTGATLTFDLGTVSLIDRVATWVDEFWGAGSIAVGVSIDGVAYTSVGSFAPTDWATSVSNYGADVFAFSASSARYVQLVLSGCPQPQSQSGGGCGMGEVAFRAAEAAAVPEPASLALVGLALAGLAASRRRRA